MKNKYILFTKATKSEYDTLEDGIKAYNECKEREKFLYQPDKTYFLGTLSSTGYKIGHDHLYHKDTAKCYGLFIADNKNQVKMFLEKSNWHHQGLSPSSSTKVRVYGNGPYGFLYQNNSKDERYGWDNFEHAIQNYYLNSGNINYFYMIDNDFGAIDIKTYENSNPYRLY